MRHFSKAIQVLAAEIIYIYYSDHITLHSFLLLLYYGQIHFLESPLDVQSIKNLKILVWTVNFPHMDNIALVLMNRTLRIMTLQSSPCHLLLIQPTDQVYWGWDLAPSFWAHVTAWQVEGHTSGGRIHQFYLCSEQWEKLLLGFVCLFCWPVFSLFSVPLVEHRHKGGISESPVCAFRWVLRTFRNSITGYQITKFINYKHREETNTDIQLHSLKPVISALDK